MTDDSTRRVAARWKAAEDPKVPDRSMKALLVNIRHEFGRPKLPDLIRGLEWLGGWTILPIEGLVNMAGNSGSNYKIDAHNLPAAEKARKELLKKQVASLPTNPTAGAQYVTNVSDIQETPYGFTVTYDYHKGAEGWKFIAPNGKIFEMLPRWVDNARQFTRDKLDVRHIEAVMKWMHAETDVRERCKEAIEAKNVVNRTRDGTGTCSVCFANIKVKERSDGDPLIVLHGYKRPGTGEIHGNCRGMEWPPYELSSKGTENFLKLVEKVFEHEKKMLSQMEDTFKQRGVFIEHPRYMGAKSITHNPDDPLYDHNVKGAIKAQKGFVTNAEKDVTFYSKMVERWKLHPLPSEKSPSPDFTRGL